MHTNASTLVIDHNSINKDIEILNYCNGHRCIPTQLPCQTQNLHERAFVQCTQEHLCNARKIANHAVLNKNNKKLLTSKHVKQFNLPSAISNQILRKYGRGTIKEAKNVNLIVPNQTTTIRLRRKTRKPMK